MEPRQAADLLLVIHALFVLCVVLPVPLIWIGGIRGWAFVRHRWFRWLHLAMIGFVVAETLFGMMCPLTVWENALRQRSGDRGYGSSFIAYWFSRLLYYDLPAWVFTAVYAAFGALIVWLYWKYPPRRVK